MLHHAFLFLIGHFIPFGTCLMNIRLFIYQNKTVLSPVLGGTHMYVMYMLHVIKKRAVMAVHNLLLMRASPLFYKMYCWNDWSFRFSRNILRTDLKTELLLMGVMSSLHSLRL